MPEGQNTPSLQNTPEGQNIAELQTDKQRIDWLNREIYNKTQELQALNIDTISSVEFGVIEKEIRGYKAELDSISKKNNPDNAEQINQLNKDYANLQQIYNQLNQQLEQTTSALNQLSNDTIASQNQSEQHQEAPEQNGPEEKGLKKWWHGLTDGEKKGIRIGGGVLAGVGIISLFKRRKKKKSSSEKSGEKKSFWERPIGKTVKWTAITLGGIFGINRLGKKFGWWKKENATINDPDKDKYESYDNFAEKPENREKFQNYESLGNKIDNVYQEMYGRELQSGYEDELEMQKIANEQSKGTKHYKGVVPYCLDNQYKTVEVILGQNSSFKAALSDGLQGMFDFVRRTSGLLEIFEDSFLKLLPSWIPFKTASGSLSERFEQWKLKNPNAEKEMQYFFRQSIRVQTYLFQKKNQLIKKLVKDASQKYGISEDDIWNDKDKFDKYVGNDPQYQNFLNSPTHAAVTVLAQNNIFDEHIDDDLKKLVAEIDNERDEILGCKKGEKDIIGVINEKKLRNEVLDVNDDRKLGEACDGVIGDMDNIIDAAEESAWNIYGDLFRTGDSNFREYLEKSGLDKMFHSLKQLLMEQRQLLKNGNLDNEKKIALSETLNSVLALKKEVKLGEWTIEKDYDESGNIVFRIPGFLSGSVKNLCKGVGKLCNKERVEGLEYIGSSMLGVGVLITATGAVLLLSKTTRSAGKVLIRTGAVVATLPVSVPGTLVYKGLNHIKPVRDFGHKINPVRYRGEKGAENLLDDLCSGKISLDRAGKIVERRSCGFFTGGAQEKARKDMFGAAEDVKGNMKAFDAIVKKQHGVSYLKDIKDSGLYDSLLSKRDVSQEIRQAVKQGKPVEELKTMVGKTSEVVSDLRRAFGTKIDDAIKVLRASNGPLEQNAIKRLENLGSKLSDDEVEAFMKMMDNGFDVKYIGHLDQLFNLKGSVKGIPNKQLGEHLKDLLMEGKYAEFKRLVSGKQVKNGLGRFKNIVSNDSSFIKHMDTFFKRKNGIRGLGDDVVECIAKTFSKIFSKVL